MGSRHWTGNLVFSGTQGGARGQCYLQVILVNEEPSTIGATGRYEDSLVKEKGQWKFSSRLLTMDAERV
jgi:hypothetical protein